MAKNKKNKNTSVKEVEVIEEVETEEEFDDEEIEEIEEFEEEVVEEDEFEEEFEEESDEYEEISLEERLANIEKKTNITFYMVIAILVVVCLSLIVALTGKEADANTETSGNTNTQQQNSVGYDTSAFKSIKPADIESLSKNKTIVVWIGYQECSFCQAYAPLLTKVTKEFGITANYIDVSTITQDELNIVTALTGKGDWKEFAASFSGTPFTLIVKNNKVVGGINGYTEAENIAAAFEAAGLKK